MKKYIIITADTNDGDYVNSKDKISNEQIEAIKPMVKAIKSFKPYKVENVGYNKSSTWTHSNNYVTRNLVRDDLEELPAIDYYTQKAGMTEEQFEAFNEFVPYSEYGIHTIVSVEILEVTKEIKLL